MPVKYDDLLTALEYVSSAPRSRNQALLCKQSGVLYWSSDFDDSFDQWPADAHDPDKYVIVPHKQELQLGRDLVRAFVAQQMPDQWPAVEQIFSRAGAYRRYRDWLANQDRLDAWREFERERTDAALRQWCRREGVTLNDHAE